LLILGDGGEGKTCISRALRKLPFEHQRATQGVDIESWEFDNPNEPGDKGKRIKLNIWDFEGQEIDHQSHQFFLTQRSLYLLVFNGRQQFNRTRVEYWLDTIRSRAPDSEVILVATHCEEREPCVPVEELRARFPGLLKYTRCFFRVGCESGRGVQTLRTHVRVRAARLDVMGTDWPESYVRAEKAIRKRSEKHPHVTRKVLYNMFRRAGIQSADDYDSVASLMGCLGVITHFPDSEELKDFIVLKPHWLTKAMSKILDDEQLSKDQGEITRSRLHGLWKADYPSLSEILHKCMREFELCYDLVAPDSCL
jgi:internalin A